MVITRIQQRVAFLILMILLHFMVTRTRKILEGEPIKLEILVTQEMVTVTGTLNFVKKEILFVRRRFHPPPLLLLLLLLRLRQRRVIRVLFSMIYVVFYLPSGKRKT